MKSSDKKLLCYGLLAAGAGLAYLVFRKPSEHVASGVLVGLQMLPVPGKALQVVPDGDVTTYGYVYPAPNPLVALGRLRGLALAAPTCDERGEPYLAFSAP